MRKCILALVALSGIVAVQSGAQGPPPPATDMINCTLAVAPGAPAGSGKMALGYQYSTTFPLITSINVTLFELPAGKAPIILSQYAQNPVPFPAGAANAIVIGTTGKSYVMTGGLWRTGVAVVQSQSATVVAP